MSDPDSLSTSLAKLFLRVHRLVDGRMAMQGASLAKTKVLMYLLRENPDARAADIAGFFGHAPRTITEMLDGLERDGLIRRVADPADRRAKRIALTTQGRDAVELTEPLRRSLIDRIYGALDEEERSNLAIILEKLSAAAEAEG